MEDKKIQSKNLLQKCKKYAITLKFLFIIISIMNIITIIFSMFFLDYFLNSPNSFQGNNINEFTNDYCNNKKNVNYNFLCTNKYYKYKIKKSKFIWIMTDGTSSDQKLLLSNYEKLKITTSFLVEGDDITYKHTNERHQTLISGKPNRNFNGKQINHDNIIQQLVNAGYKINYRGWDLPIPHIIGDTKNGIKENKIFNKKFIDNDHEVLAFSSFCNITNPFPFTKISYDKYQNPIPNKEVDKDLLNKITTIINKYKNYLYNKEDKLQLFDNLDELFKQNPIDLFTINIDDCLKKSFDWNENENISILFYTTEVDHHNHIYGKNHIYTSLQMYITEKMIKRIMEWINIHDDYALIITADHGGQEFYGEDSLKNHGKDNPGNEAIFFIYTKELKDNYDKLKMRERYIHMIDESTIIPQILLNINIPILSRGFPQQIIEDNINHFISLKMKEIQLIKLIENYIRKYSNYENNLKYILNELKSNYLLTNEIINEYISKNLTIYSNKLKDFQNLLEDYKNSLIKNQKEINKIIDNLNKATGNIILFITIFIFIFIKFCFEIYFLFFKIIDIEKAKINTISNKVWFFINIVAFIFFYIFLFFINIINIDFRTGIIRYCFYYGYFISIIYFYYIFIILRLDWHIHKEKIILLIGSIFFFTEFFKNLNYSDFIYYLKKSFSNFSNKNKIFINFFSYYLFLIIYILKEMNKFKEKNYFIYFCKKNINIDILYYFYFLLVISLFFEDFTKKDYLDQNMANIIFLVINLLLFIIFYITTNFFIYEEKKILNEEEDLFDENNNSYDIINSNGQNINQNKEIDLFEIQISNKRKVKGFPNIKLFLIFILYWISDDFQKVGLIIILPFLEIFNYLSNGFYSKINGIGTKQNNDLSIEILNMKSINEQQNDKNKNSKKNNYLFYFFFYLTLQDIILVGNISVFALTNYSFGKNIQNFTKSKFIYMLKFLKSFCVYISRYQYILIILGFFLEKEIDDKYNNQQYSIDFLARKILLGLRIDLEIIYFFYQMLINVNDKIFIDLDIYCYLNISLLLFDYIGYFFSKIRIIIYKNSSKMLNFIEFIRLN